MRRVYGIFFIIVMVMLAAGCQSTEISTQPTNKSKYGQIKPGPINIGSLRFNNPDYWSQQKNGELISWTQDGILLNEIVFGRLNAGQNILGQKGNIRGDFDYDPDMSLNLVVEQFTDALKTSTYHNIVIHEFSRLRISNNEAVKFKISYDASSVVNYSAWALFVKKSNRLITIFCSATTRYYFPKLEKTYLQLLDSVQII